MRYTTGQIVRTACAAALQLHKPLPECVRLAFTSWRQSINRQTEQDQYFDAANEVSATRNELELLGLF